MLFSLTYREDLLLRGVVPPEQRQVVEHGHGQEALATHRHTQTHTTVNTAEALDTHTTVNTAELPLRAIDTTHCPSAPPLYVPLPSSVGVPPA